MRQPPPIADIGWTGHRIARLAFLVGQGLDTGSVARDAGVETTPGNVRRQARRFGLTMCHANDRRLPRAVRQQLDLAARRRGLTREHLIRRLAIVAGSDATLLDNILDDHA